jgi:hypothetical protein
MAGICSTGTVVTAASAAYVDVSAAVVAAGRGGTVLVPAGSATWNKTLVLSQGVTLKGSNPTVTSSSMMIMIAPDATAIANSENIKVSGFTFDGGDAAVIFIEVDGAGEADVKPYRNVIIGDNTFRNGSSGTNNGAIRVGGQVRGVVYNNTFDRCNIILRPMGNDSTVEWSNPAYNRFSYGSADNLYFEDNRILWSSPYASADGSPGWIESGQGGRVVVRYNSWDLANVTGQSEFWDAHGFQNFYGTNNGQTGTMIVEYYGNKMINGANTVYRWLVHRGSWGMFFDNTYAGASNPSMNIQQYDGGCTSQIVPAPSNYDPLVNNTYGFNNTVNGANQSLTPGDVNSCGVTENVNFWNYDASCTSSLCAAGIGAGTAAPTGTCANGTGYWVASTPAPTTSSSAIQGGSFYQCINGVWRRYYTPYTYPQPLRNTP